MKRKSLFCTCRGILEILFGFAAVLYYLAVGITAGFRISVLWVWLVAGVVILLLGVADIFFAYCPCRMGKIALSVLQICILICVAVFFFVQILVISGMHQTCPVGLDYIIVPGAIVEGQMPGKALLARIDCAWEYLERNPETKVILSGGQGPGEWITEAECMRRVLLERGIAPERMLLEESSRSTAENMRFSYAAYGNAEASVGVVTSNFHVYRSMRLARHCGWKNVYGMAAPFNSITLVHYMAREFLTISVDTLRGNM